MDFPAAHSMDTDWYAVDRDGRVAHCHSGEVGPVPHDAFRKYWYDVSMTLVVVRIVEARDDGPRDATELALVRQIVDGDTAARTVYADHREARGLGPGGWSAHAPGIYTFTRGPLVLTTLAALPERFEGVFVFASERDMTTGLGWTVVDERHGLPHAVVGDFDRATFIEWWSAGMIAQAFLVEEPAPHELGLYEYHHDWGYGPYARDTVPEKPIVVDELPEPLREQIEQLRLRAVAFAEAPSLDPAALVPCARYD